MNKSIGNLIDELSIANIKSFYFQETVMNNDDPVKVSEAAKKAQSTNATRSKLIQAINQYFEDQSNIDHKTYG